MDFLFLSPVTAARGLIQLPGSKSISNRALLLAALSRGTTELTGVLDADDTRVMREALWALGVRVQELDGPEHLSITGVGPGPGFPVKEAQVFLGNSGTSARSLAAVLAFSDGTYRLSGVPRMHERPIGDLVDALRPAGAGIEYTGNEGFPPLAISARAPVAIPLLRIRGDVSSQFLSGVLMALPWSGQAARVEIEGELISKPYVELTLGLMERFGVTVQRDEWKSFDVPAGGYRSPGRYAVEGDASSASYFLAAGLLGGGPVRVQGVGRASAQGDVRFTEVVQALGGMVRFGDDWIESSGTVPLAAFDLDMNLIPDAAMTAAVLALFAEGPCTLRNIASWRVKETDRIAAMATELRKFGARVQEGGNFLRIFPPHDLMARRVATTVAPVAIDTYDDHRMAMCFSLASFGPRPVRINDPRCVAKTYPRYFDDFARLVS